MKLINKKSKNKKIINKKSTNKKLIKKKSINRKSNLGRWFKEKWVNVCNKKSGKYVVCGRKKSNIKKYPYCRPLVRINKKTPMTVNEIKKKYGSNKLKSMCNKKNSKKNKKSMTYLSKSKSKKSKNRKWSNKYKKSINCRKPKGFSQKQYCKYGKKY